MHLVKVERTKLTFKGPPGSPDGMGSAVTRSLISGINSIQKALQAILTQLLAYIRLWLRNSLFALQVTTVLKAHWMTI
jgi:hypothetical protein